MSVEAKKYTLIKEYPDSPKIGDVVVESKGTNGNTINYLLLSSIATNLRTLDKHYIENFPDFWEQIKASN